MPKQSIGIKSKIKIEEVVSYLRKKGANYQFITSSENNAWLLNIRGHDTKYTPIPYCHILIDQNSNLKLFCDLKKISNSLKKKFNKIDFLSIDMAEKVLSKIKRKKFIIDKDTCSSYFENIILKNNKILKNQDPIYLLKIN